MIVTGKELRGLPWGGSTYTATVLGWKTASVGCPAVSGRLGVPAVKPGDALFIRTDVRFSHEYVTPMADALFRAAMGDDASVNDPASVWMFRDHLTFLDRIMPEAHIKMGLREQAQELATVQAGFAKKHRVKLYGEVVRDGKTVGSEAICHNKVIEEIALPGQLVAGHDLALLLLAEPAAVAPVALVDAPPPELVVGATVRLVALGAPADHTDGGQRLAADATVAAVTANDLTLDGPGVPCGADSGGAAFLATAVGERLVGAIKASGAGCVAPGYVTAIAGELDGHAARRGDLAAARAALPDRHAGVAAGAGVAEARRAQVAVAAAAAVALGQAQRAQRTVVDGGAARAAGVERRLPARLVEQLLPAVEARAGAPRVLDHRRHPPIAAGQEALDPRHAAVVVLQPQLAIAHGHAQERLLAADLGVGVLRAPLQRRVRLGHVRRHADRDLGLAAADHALADAQHALAGLDDAAHVVVLLGGQADHEVQLDPVPPALEDLAGRLLDVGLGDVLVHHVAHALSAGLGREGQPGDPGLGQLVEDLVGQAVGAQAGHRHRHAARAQRRRQLADQRRDAREVGGRQAGQAGLLVAGPLEQPAQLGTGNRRIVDEQQVEGVRLVTIAGHGETWVMWAAAGHVIKLGGRGRTGVPDDLRQAVMLLAAGYYEGRTGAEGKLPVPAEALLARWMPVRVTAGGHR